MKFNELSSRAKDVAEKLTSWKAREGVTGLTRKVVKDAIKDSSIWRTRGAGRITVNELRKYAGLKPETIKRCPCCGQVIK